VVTTFAEEARRTLRITLLLIVGTTAIFVRALPDEYVSASGVSPRSAFGPRRVLDGEAERPGRSS